MNDRPADSDAVESGPVSDDRVVAELSAAVEAGDLTTATAVLRTHWFELLRSHGETLRRVLDTIPSAELRSHPLLTSMLGVCYNGVPHRRVKALRYFSSAVRSARAGRHEMDPIDRALIFALESVAYRLIGHPTMSVGPARAALRVLDAMPESELEAFGSLPRIYSVVGTSLYYGGKDDEALAAYRAGLSEALDSGSSEGFGNVAMLAGIHAWRGDLHEAREYVELATSAEWTDDQRSRYTGTFYRIAEAVLALERFDPAAAREHLTAMVNDQRTIEHWVVIAKTEALTALLSGRPGEGLSRLDAVSAMRNEGRSAGARSALSTSRALLQLAVGGTDAARVILRRDAPDGPHRHIAQARVELVTGQNGAALRELRAVAGADLSLRSATDAATIEAAALLRYSTSARSVAVIEQLGSALEHSGQRLALALIPPADLDRVRSALVDRGFGALFDGIPIRSVLLDGSTDSILSERELVVLEALMRTPSASGIAAELVVSVNTVKTQLRSIYRKLGVSSRDEVIAVALDRHLLSQRDD